MKNVKKVLAATALSGAVLIGAGFGTYSWFTTSATVDGNITNGTLKITNQTPSGKVFSKEKFAPSQATYGSILAFKNTGNLDQVGKATYTATLTDAEDMNNVDLSKYSIIQIAVKYNSEPKNAIQLFTKYLDERTSNLTSNSLMAPQKPTFEGAVEVLEQELVNNSMNSLAANSKKESDIVDESKFWSTKPGQVIYVSHIAVLKSDAGNAYQGAKYNATFTINGKQTDARADWK
ncbi:hypothetical protein IHV12_04940 [Fictibacillus sp. 7GRE50]|uniref:TasA family protein n=1 Tax=Fictibacillus sp. 7GRE50 TaxID=2745878 RepID=UPI0018CF1EAF|nr:TasA family protein [Fictibacillus sp. 7GRE50]MBH0164249.1 hypothetical protein [Fictibacillus sp. 7GRE50]